MNQSIAIVGMACRYPDARTPAELWENALAGRRAFRRLPPERLRGEDYHPTDHPSGAPGGVPRPDSTYVERAAVLQAYEFDRARFRIPRAVFEAADLTHWLALEVASDALADAGFPDGAGLPRDSVGVLLGNSLTGEFARAGLMRLRWPYVSRVVDARLAEAGWEGSDRRRFVAELEERYKAPFPPPGDETLAGGLSNTIAGRICNHFDLHGGGYTVDGACASSLLAIANACSALVAGDLDVALAGGVDLSLDPFELVGFARVGALATDEMRVYDARPTGFLPGEGCGVVVLMRHEDARARGLPVLATISGWGVSSDGRGGLTRPEASGQLLAIRRAYRRAGFGIDTLAYVEGHGTGTAVGDPTEIAAVTAAIREVSTTATDPIAIGSVKANIGHTKAASGVAGLIKACLAVRHRIVPPTTGCETPHPDLAAPDAALRVVAAPTAWPAGRAPRAGVNSMGFGGINVHVALEGERAARPVRIEPRWSRASQDAESYLLVGKTHAEVAARARHIAAYADRLSVAELTDLAAELEREVRRRSSSGASAARVRAAVVAASADELAERLRDLAGACDCDDRQGVVVQAGLAVGQGSARPRVGLLFPGQASPVYFGGGVLVRRFPFLAKTYRHAALPASGDPLATELAQPAIAAASALGISALEHLGIDATTAVGHSVGEFAALYWAGSCDEAALLDLVRARGGAMARHGRPGGAMAGIRADASEVAALIGDEPVVIAAMNSPSQTVVAGERDAVARVCNRAVATGLRATVLPVAHAFHSPLMEDVAPALLPKLDAARLLPPQRRVVSTITGAILDQDEDLSELLLHQLTTPVRFREALLAADEDVDLWIETGPGSVLGALAGAQVETPVVSLDSGGESLRGLLEVASVAFALGAPLRSESLFADRFTRPFDVEWQPRFLTSPCELAPVGTPATTVPETTADRPSAKPPTRAADDPPEAARSKDEVDVDVPAVDIVRALVAQRLELPLASIEPGHRLLADLHLNSISVGEVAAGAARRLGLAPPEAPTEFANATVGELADALDDIRRTGVRSRRDKGERVPAGVGEWVEPFTVEWRSRPSPARPRQPDRDSRDAEDASSWRVIAPPDHALAAELERTLAGLAGGGTVVCVPPAPELEGSLAIRLLLDGARSALDRGRGGGSLVVVHHGIGGAFAKTFYLESPATTTCVIEVPPGHPDAARWVAAEAESATGFTEVRYVEDGRRLEPRLRWLEAERGAAAFPVDATDVILVTGGGKGIAAECALELAQRTGVRLALLGRSSPDDDEELAANLRRLASAGVDVQYFAADVTDGGAVAEAVRNAEAALGTITGVVHGAGTNSPRLVAALDETECAATLAPKIHGLRHVLAAVDADRLRLLVTFSSIIARMGLVGEADYALANEWLSVLTERFGDSHPGCRVVALEWSVWSGVGMGERLGRIEALLESGVTPIRPDRGAAVFLDLVRRPLPAARVVVTGRFGSEPTLRTARAELPLLRFIERPRVHVPHVELVVDVELSSARDPYLDDHEYAGQKLLPGVVMLEGMAQLAMALLGTDRLPRFEDVQFDRAVVVPADSPITVRFAALRRGTTRVDLVVRSEQTDFVAEHARAACHFDESPQPAAAVRPPGVATDLATDDTATKNGSVPLDVEHDLYDRLLFHRGRFRRLAGYRLLRATECVADVVAQPNVEWFGDGVPDTLLLGDPAVRDAAIHAIQACIPHARLLPAGVERVVPGRLASGDEHAIHARERFREGDLFVYDVEIRAADGRVEERWEGLRLRKVEALEVTGQWAQPLLGPYIERRMQELVAGVDLTVALRRDDADRETRTSQAVRSVLGPPPAFTPVIVAHRPDGKPEVRVESAARRAVSISHANGLTLACAGSEPLGCDIELVEVRAASAWRDLLGVDRFRLAELVGRESGADIDAAGSRVWAAIECLKKAGAAADAPLTLARVAPDGWITLASGSWAAGTYVATVAGTDRRVAIALLVEGADTLRTNAAEGDRASV